MVVVAVLVVVEVPPANGCSGLAVGIEVTGPGFSKIFIPAVITPVEVCDELDEVRDKLNEVELVDCRG